MRLGRKPLCVLSLLFFLSLSGTISASEPTYTVSQTQLNEWTQLLKQLKENNKELKTQSEERSRDLILLKKQLTESQTAIDEAMKRQKEAEQSLNDLNSYWEKYKDSNRATEERLKRQRNTWAIIAAVAVSAAAMK